MAGVFIYCVQTAGLLVSILWINSAAVCQRQVVGGRSDCAFGVSSNFGPVSTIGFVSLGEKVSVEIPAQTSSACSFPRHFDVRVVRQHDEDIILQLTANEVTTSPNHVVLMNFDEVTLGTRYQRVQIPHILKAYHSVRHGASFVVRCHTHNKTNTDQYTLDGTFFHKGSKFKLYRTDDDVDTSSSDIIKEYVMDEIAEFNDPQDHDYIDILESANELQSDRDNEERIDSHHRKKRSKTSYYIDILPVIDYNLYQRWFFLNKNDVLKTLSAINVYMTNVFTSMSLRLSSLTLQNDVDLNLQMLSPHLSTSPSSAAFSENIKEVNSDGTVKISVVTLLANFRDWLSNATANFTRPVSLPQYDHAMLFTSFDVYGGRDGEIGNNLTKGLAYVGTICRTTSGYSSSVVQDRLAYQSEPVAVHELGHSLGSHHDGQNNSCNSLDRYIMSSGTFPEYDNNTFNPFRFSDCSSSAISTIIGELEKESFLTTCLEKKTGTDIASVGIAPLNATYQCQALFGSESYVCRGSNIPPIEDICVSMYCSLPGTFKCRELLAATGTCCGNGKYCIEGHCETAPSGDCVTNEECPLEDQTGVIAEGKTCEEFDPYRCYNDDFYSRCCRWCQKNKENTPGCPFGDKQPGCKEGDCRATFSNGVKYSFICCQTCNNTDCLDQSKVVFRGTSYTCPNFLKTNGKDYCYFQVIHDDLCCESCEAERSSNSDCPYGDALAQYSCHLIKGLGRPCNDLEKKLCCETCPSLTVATKATAAPTVPQQTDKATPKVLTTRCTGDLCDAGVTASVSMTLLAVNFIVVLFLFHTMKTSL